MVAKKEITSAELFKMLTGVQQMLHWQMDLVEEALGRLDAKKILSSKVSRRKSGSANAGKIR